MDHPSQNQHGNIPHPSANFGSVPKDSESFGSVRNATEEFRSVPQISERKESHTLTVREVARMFEAAGVARTERSIVNWCQFNRTGIARLDSYFDPNERRYYISPQSVESAIAEEKAKSTKNNDASELFGTVPPAAETIRKTKPSAEGDDTRVKELERENLDLKITNRAKDIELERMDEERKSFFDQLLSANHKIGGLENKLHQIESPAPQQIEAEK
jgi:hypothetical protein